MSDDFKICDNTDIININKEYVVSSESKRNIEKAIAHAIMNGATVDIRKDSATSFSPKVMIKADLSGVSIEAGVTITKQSTKIYRMKD